MLIIQRLRGLPTPRTVTTTYTGRGYIALEVSKTASAVFDVPELLESILSHVNMRDLVAVRRVNKAMFRLIETSPTLQMKLFLLPGKIPPGYLGWACDDIPIRLFSSEVMWGSSSNIIAGKNPLLATNWSEMSECRSSTDGHGVSVPLDLLVSAKIKARIFESNVWPEMYLTSPPFTGVIISFECTEESQGRHILRLDTRRSIYDPTGVTFATVWDALHKEGEVRVWGGYKPLSEECHDSKQVMNTSVREQIELHRRKGIKVSLNRDRFLVESFSVAVLAGDKECAKIECNEHGRWELVQASEW
jgi:hypothetical protein